VLDVDYSDDPDGAKHLAYMERLLRCPGRRLSVARNQEGAVLGFTLALPIHRESVARLDEHGWLAPLVHAYFRHTGAPVPASPEASRTWYFVQIGHRGEQVEGVTAALWRDVFGVLTLGDTFLVSVALPEQKQLFEAFGFERVPGAIGRSWVKDQPIEGFLLDLSRVGLEPWIEAVMAGRRPPRPLPEGELEGEVQAALAHWHEPGWLEHSPLVTSAEVARVAPGRLGAEAVRQALLETLESARATSAPDRALALQAVELAYLRNGLSHEAAAEQLAVSRTTFYRLLKRGVQALAEGLSLV
jgi:hypothetical protein